jgi:hypothetical protein
MNEESGSAWVVVHATDPARGDLVIRLDEGADTVENVAAFPVRLGVAVPLVNAGGFALLDPLEQQIRELVEAAGAGTLVAVISGTSAPMFREAICYVERDFDLAAFRTVLSTRLPHLDIQAYMESDPHWGALKALKK